MWQFHLFGVSFIKNSKEHNGLIEMLRTQAPDQQEKLGKITE